MLAISFNKHCIVPSLYILYCLACCYGQRCQVLVHFFWETRQKSGFSFFLLCSCSWPVQCDPLLPPELLSKAGKLEATPLSLNLYNQQQSILSLDHCGREANTGMDSLSSQGFLKSGRNRNKQIDQRRGKFLAGELERHGVVSLYGA